MNNVNTIFPPTYADCVEVDEVSQFLVLFHSLLFPLVNTNTNQMRIHKFRPDRGQKFICAKLNEGQFSSIENHDHLEVKGQ